MSAYVSISDHQVKRCVRIHFSPATAQVEYLATPDDAELPIDGIAEIAICPDGVNHLVYRCELSDGKKESERQVASVVMLRTMVYRLHAPPTLTGIDAQYQRPCAIPTPSQHRATDRR
jgi:hypothetical protein